MNELRLDYFLSVGGLLHEDDALHDGENNHGITFISKIPEGEAFAGQLNMTCLDDGVIGIYGDSDIKGVTIKSFAPRKNEYVMPCDGNLPLICTRSIGISHAYAKDLSFCNCGSRTIKTWTPDIKTLLKMQNEHDKATICKTETAEPKTIMDAFKVKEGDLINGDLYSFVCNSQLLRGIYNESRSSFFLGANKVCGFSEASLIEPATKPKPSVYTQAMVDAGEPPKVGMNFLAGKVEGDSRIIDFEGKRVTVISIVKFDKGWVITFYHETIGLGCGNFMPFWVLPIDTRTEKEKAVDAMKELCAYKGSWNTTYKTFAESLYDAGYRVTKTCDPLGYND